MIHRALFPSDRTRALTGGLGILLVVSLLEAPASPAADGDAKLDPITTYEVDPSWPRRPNDMPWSDMPGIAVDAQDRVWVFTRSEEPVQVYTAGGEFIRSWGKGAIGRSHHIRVDHEGNVWLADPGKHVVRKYTEHGRLLATLGTPDEPGEDAAHFNQPTDMAVTPSGDVFISDGYGNNRVVHYDRHGKFVRAWGKRGTAPGEFNLPHGIALDSRGRLYVADRSNGRIQVFDQSGRFLAQWRNLVIPWGVWITRDDEVWVCGSSPMGAPTAGDSHGVPPKDQVFLKFNPDGKLLQLWTVPKGEDGKEKPGELNWVHAIAVDSRGNLYAGDIRGKRAQKFVRKVEPIDS